MSVPNQKKIMIERTSDKSTKDYLKVSNKNLELAMYNLKPSTFMLWIYFLDNCKGYILNLYPIDFINKTGVSRSTYDRSFKELEELGYLVKSEKEKNLYLFKEVSESNKIRDIDEIWSLEKANFEEIKEKYFS